MLSYLGHLLEKCYRIGVPLGTSNMYEPQVFSDAILLHPQKILGEHFDEFIDESWSALKTDAHKQFASFDREIADLERYLKRDGDIRPFGAIAPWFLGEIFGVPPEKLRETAKYWIAHYLWCICIDSAMDSAAPVPPKDHMLFTVLFSYSANGLGDLISTDDGKQELRNYITEAICWQTKSIQNSSVSSYQGLRDVAVGKNLLFAALARVIADIGGTSPDLAVQFTKNYALAMQHLDDISDFYDDHKQKIPTLLLQYAKDRSDIDFSSEDDIDVLFNQILNSGALHEVLSETDTLIGECLKSAAVIVERTSLRGEGRSSDKFLINLRSAIRDAKRSIENQEGNDIIKSRLRVIYMSS